MAGLTAGKPAGGVGCGGGGGASDLVVGGVVLALAVVEGADNDGAVNVAVDEVDQDFLAYAG